MSVHAFLKRSAYFLIFGAMMIHLICNRILSATTFSVTLNPKNVMEQIIYKVSSSFKTKVFLSNTKILKSLNRICSFHTTFKDYKQQIHEVGKFYPFSTAAAYTVYSMIV